MNYVKKMLSNPGNWKKFWMALTAPLGALLLAMAPTDAQAAFVVTQTEWYVVLAALASAVGVERVANR